MSKEVSFKQKIKELTFYDGRLWQPGETLEFVGDSAHAAAEHYGKKLGEPTPENPAQAKLTQAVKANKATESE